MSNALSEFGSSSLPAGTYRVDYTSGAMTYSNASAGNQGYRVNAFTDGGDGFEVAENGNEIPAMDVHAPGTEATASTSVSSFSAINGNAFTFTGGTLGIYLHDNPYGDNAPGSGTTPTFKLEEVIPNITIVNSGDATIWRPTSTGDTDGDPATFTVTRSGGDISQALVVNLTYGGTAVSGTDYDTPPSTVTFSANQATTTLMLTPDFSAQSTPVTATVAVSSPPPPSSSSPATVPAYASTSSASVNIGKLDGTLGEIESDNTTELPHATAVSTGGYVMLNDDNDDYKFANADGTGSPVVDLDKTNIVGEHDLLKLKLHAESDPSIGGYYFLSTTAGLKLWNQETKATPAIPPFDATHDDTVYVEGVAESSAAAADSVTLFWSRNQNGAGGVQIDKVKYTVWEMKGPQDVPAYGTYQYSIDVPGQQNGNGTWDTSHGNVTNETENAASLQVKWDGGPDVGSVKYSPDGGNLFEGEWDVNVVEIDVSVPTQNQDSALPTGQLNPVLSDEIGGTVIPGPGVNPNTNVLSETVQPELAHYKIPENHAGEWSFAEVKLVGPGANANLGISRIQVGFIQNVNGSLLTGYYGSKMLSDSLNTQITPQLPVLDGPPDGSPWLTDGTWGFTNSTTSKELIGNDSPLVGVPIDFEQTKTFTPGVDTPLTYMTAELSFQLNVCATTNEAPPENPVYVREASTNWYFNGSGNVASDTNNGVTEWAWSGDPGAGISSDPSWVPATDGSHPVTAGPTANSLSKTSVFN